MSANASDKPDNSKRVEKDLTELDLKLFEDSQPSDSSATCSSSAKTEADLDITTDPFGRKFNEVNPVVQPKAADSKLPDAFTDPFAPEFTNLPKPGEVTKPGEKGTKSGGSNDPFDPFGDWTVPSDLFPAKPGTKPGDTTPPQDTTVKPDASKPDAPKPDVPKPDVPKPDAPKPEVPPSVPKPDVPVKPGDQPVKPGDQPVKPNDAPQPNPVFNENNVGEAIKLAQSKNQPIYVFSSPNGQLDQAQQEAMKAHGADAVFVNVNFSHADQMMRAGLETTHYWQLANLCGAGGDVNNLYQKPGFMGRFNATDFNANDPRSSLKAAATGDLKTVFAGQVKPPAPAPDGPVKPDAPRTDRQPDSPAKPRETRGADAPLPSGVMSENDVQAAQQAAKAKGIPMLSYLDNSKGSNEKLAKAMQYLSENGLASTVKIDRQNAEGMLQRGLETSKFYALKNSMLRTPDVAQDGSSHLSAFSPNNFGQPTGCTEAAKSPEEIVSFFKKSGVDLSKGNAEAAVLGLLGGKSVPPPAPEVEKPDATPVEPEKKPEAIKPEVKPEAKPEVKPEAPPQPEVKPEAKPEAKPEVKPETPPQPEVKPEVKPEAPPQPQFNPEPMVLPATPGQVEPEVKPALNLELTLPKASDILRAKAEKLAENPNKVKVKDADEALKVMEDAKARGIDLVVHSLTFICTPGQCAMTKLPEAVADEFSEKAVLMELPRGGVKVPDGAQYDALRAINDLYKISSKDHKTQLDLHVYSFNKDKGYQLNDESSLSKDIAKSVASKWKIK